MGASQNGVWTSLSNNTNNINAAEQSLDAKPWRRQSDVAQSLSHVGLNSGGMEDGFSQLLKRALFTQTSSAFPKTYSVEGLHAIVVSDRDGVPVIKGGGIYRALPGCTKRARESSAEEPVDTPPTLRATAVANDSAPEHALRPGFLSTFALATDQGSKLGLSKNKSIICYYNTYQRTCSLFGSYPGKATEKDKKGRFHGPPALYARSEARS
ncbi:ragulator complex protein LAMTOR3 isoform X2 [Ornithorhynchus anatinus]|uniref:ragulator complex protein LAMTOR3 isoform X2 n=1 Tax=Ornithorhynchus anatinus TaxID=9258 RepID=UPI0019D462FC|nr:ragulator complex protein LAMTOR3 isoform X2 [Ornithorhynchus anatinus]